MPNQPNRYQQKKIMPNPITQYGWARINGKQEKLIRKYTTGKTVLDIGAGKLELSHFCARYATHVTAIDSKNPQGYKEPLKLPHNITFVEECFNKVTPIKADVALLSWPINNEPATNGILPLIKDIPIIIYIGYNDGRTTMTGTTRLWKYLTSRRLIERQLPDTNDSLLIYGSEPRSANQRLTCEERYGITAY